MKKSLLNGLLNKQKGVKYEKRSTLNAQRSTLNAQRSWSPYALGFLAKNLIIFLLSASLLSCSSTTTIRAVDPQGSIDRDVKIYLDGSYKGKGEVLHSDTDIVGTTKHVSLKKENCRSLSYTFSRAENLSVGALIGGIFFLVPFLWIMGYKPLRSYEFNCEK